MCNHVYSIFRLNNVRTQKRIVPMGPAITTIIDRQKIVDNNARRLEVLRNCVNFIFENKISDARIVSLTCAESYLSLYRFLFTVSHIGV